MLLIHEEVILPPRGRSWVFARWSGLTPHPECLSRFGGRCRLRHAHVVQRMLAASLGSVSSKEALCLREDIEHHYAESEREPDYDVAQQVTRAAAIATEHASAKIDNERREDRHIAERSSVEPGDHAKLGQDQQDNSEREEEEGSPSRHL
jgi:hypothetical protein